MFIRKFKDTLEQRLNEDLGFLQILIGPRQVGKTTAMEQIAEKWTGSKLLASADGAIPPDSRWLDLQWRRALEMPRPTLLVIDEIQKVQGWSGAVKELYDRNRKDRHFRVVLLGSASISIQKGLTESLAGRYEWIKAPHWSFKECRTAFGWDLMTYLKFGGYPAPAELIYDKQRWQDFMRESIVEPVLGRDLQDIVTIQKPALFRQLFELAMHLPAQELSFQKMLGQLQEGGNASTIKHYLEILAGAFLVRTIPKFHQRPLLTKTSSPKILPLAPALVHAFTDPQRVDDDPEWRGRMLETVVGMHLSHMRGQLYYWRERNFEVDYVYVEDGKIFGIEVKSGRKRSLHGLKEFCRIYPKAIPCIVDWENAGEWLAQDRIEATALKT